METDKISFFQNHRKTRATTTSRLRKQERGVWQRRFRERAIRDEEDFNRHVDYIHINPVKHGYVKQVSDWQFSSFHRYVRLGILSADWAGTGNDSLDLE